VARLPALSRHDAGRKAESPAGSASLLDELPAEAFCGGGAEAAAGAGHAPLRREADRAGNGARHERQIAEMKDREGKTGATLAYLNASPGAGGARGDRERLPWPRRDASGWAGCIASFGLSVGLIQQDMPRPSDAQLTLVNITLCTNSESLGFDYLRDIHVQTTSKR